MYQFVVGKVYQPNDRSFDPVRVTKRTARFVFLENPINSAKWRMLIRTDADGNEYATDSSVPARYRDDFTYQAKYPCLDWE